MLEFSKEEIVEGIFSSLIILGPVILMVCLFRKSIPSSKNKSRFDKVVEEAAQDGRINLPDRTYRRKTDKEKLVSKNELSLNIHLFFCKLNLLYNCHLLGLHQDSLATVISLLGSSL